MDDLKPKTPFDSMVALRIGGVIFGENTLGPLTLISPFKGQTAALSEMLKAVYGLDFPNPNRLTESGAVQAQWFGYDQALLIGATPDPSFGASAALSDQSDAWAVATLQGPRAVDVLARLTPLDLRDHVFQIGHAARSDLMHMSGAIARTGPDSYRVMVFRSMAQTLLHDVQRAMEAVAARG